MIFISKEICPKRHIYFEISFVPCEYADFDLTRDDYCITLSLPLKLTWYSHNPNFINFLNYLPLVLNSFQHYKHPPLASYISL